MLKRFLFPGVIVCGIVSVCVAAEFPDPAALPSRPELPDPLVMLDGTRITTASDWNAKRKPELKALFQHYMYGYLPPKPAKWEVEKVLFSDSMFLAGYGAAQAVPGPLFTFAAYLGSVMAGTPNGWPGGMLCLLAVFLPSFLLVVGALPFWEALRGHPAIRAALTGVNAGVVGLLLAALYDPIWTTAVRSHADSVWRLPRSCCSCSGGSRP